MEYVKATSKIFKIERNLFHVIVIDKWHIMFNCILGTSVATDVGFAFGSIHLGAG